MKWYLKVVDAILWVFKHGSKKRGGSTIVFTKYEKKSPSTVKQKKGNIMYLKLDRVWYTKESTIGKLFVDGYFECYMLEDYDRLSKGRRKKDGETAIPRGTYDIRITYSPRFKRRLPLLINVPGFTGIRIHAGNTAKDTEGCLLPGATRNDDFVGQSKRAFSKLFKKLETARQESKQIKITIA